MKLVCCILETFPGQIDNALPSIVGMLLAELHVALSNKCPINYKSMIVQATATAFYNNSILTFQILEKENQTARFFEQWLQMMGGFKLEFELRRIIFGLIAIIRTPLNQMPPFIADRMPALCQQLAILSIRVFAKRE